MESEQQEPSGRDAAPRQWRSCKLIIDPSLTNGLYKVYRYDGQHFNIPQVEDLGVFPVAAVRDPRVRRLWSRCDSTDLVVPRFKIDECYVGPIPPKEVTFCRLNDNVREGFLTDMCKKYGHVEEVEIFYNPKTKKHLGIAKVIFDTVRAAKDAVQHLHRISVMGNIIHVEIDPKGENRMRYLQLLLSGLYTPWTLPVGSSEQTLQSLIDNLPGSTLIHRRGNISSPTSIATPLSLDTAYSSIWWDTPCSFGLTPGSQGSPHTPRLCGTPLSQDSCYASLQGTPVFQGEPTTNSVHKPSRQEIVYRKPTRYHGRSRKSSDLTYILKHFKPQPPLLHAQIQNPGNRQQPSMCSQDSQTSVDSSAEPSFPFSPPNQESREEVTTISKALPLNCNSLSILSINVSPERQAAASCPPAYKGCTTESSLPASNAFSGSPHPEVDSLDSRIEMMLKKSQSTDTSFIDGRASEAAVHQQDSPTSPCLAALDYSLDCTPALGGSPTNIQQTSHSAVMNVSATTPDNEGDEPVQTVASYLTNSPSPISSHLTRIKRRANVNKYRSKKDVKRLQSSCPQELVVLNEHKEGSNKQSRPLIQTKELSSPAQSSAFSSLNNTTQHLSSKPPWATISMQSHPPVTPFPISSVPPSMPLFPVCLPSGTIPFPPPAWLPPPGHHTCIPVPPPPIPPPPTLFGPPPPLIAPPSVAHPVHPYPLHMERFYKENPPRPCSAPLSFCGPPWPSLPFPMFNPLVPPPGYLSIKESSHKITVEKVLEVIMEELKSIIKRDMTRRMVESVAFRLFDEWWDCQEKKAKIAVAPLKIGVGSVEEGTRSTKDFSHIIGQGKKIQLPSFKVKRKGHCLATLEEPKNVLSSTHESDQLTNSVKLGDDRARLQPEGGGSSALKRRHARPLELDSDDEDEEEDNKSIDTETMLDKEEPVLVDDDPKVQCNRGELDDEEEEEAVQKYSKGKDIIISKATDGVQLSDSEILSETGSSEESDYSSDFESSDSYSTQSTGDSSYSDLSSEEDEDMEDSCIEIPPDEESMDLEPPVTPSAPLTPGAELELGLHDWSEGLQRREPQDDLYTCKHDPSDLDAVMNFVTSDRQDSLTPPSPIGIPVVEPNFDVEVESPEWRMESLDNMERPLTPSGYLIDSDPELPIRHKTTPSAVEVEERPHTPGQGIVAHVETGDCMDELLSFSPASSEAALSPSELQVSYTVNEDMPKTPGAEERGRWTPYSSGRAPATPGRETTLSEASTVRSPPLSSPLSFQSLQSNNLYTSTPRTPGRTTAHQKRARMMTTSQGGNVFFPLLCDESLTGSPIVVSSPCRLSESSAETPDEKGVWMSAGVRTKPLQGLENMPGLLHEESRRETERFLLWREQRRWQKMRRKRRKLRQRQRQRSLKRVTASVSSLKGPYRCRSLCEEMRILHSVWKKGLDEEDAGLLHITYERLKQQDNAFGWLSDTIWIPHPLTRVSAEKSEEHSFCQQKHMTGCARSEGFYKISRKDKLKYLNTTWLPTDTSTASTQGICIPARPPAPLRAGSDFRSEQRRLLSSFSCDSDLVKFNQLKFRKKRIRFCRSHIHEWGLFAMEPIAADEMVIEYVGQTIRQVIADMREKRYEDEGIGSSYMFRIAQDAIIDATKCGNLARFINHSCNPNCYAKIITVESQKKIVIYSRQPISINEEITYDYKFPLEDEKIPCLCGAGSCRGSLN